MNSALWYLSRATGITSLALLTLVLVLGVLTRGSLPLARLPRFVTLGLHRNTSLLAVLFLAVHVTTAVADPYAMTRLVDVVIPFRGGYRPLWVGLGTLSLDLLVAIVITSLVRHRLPEVVWRTLHWAAYALWPMAALHGVFAGTDAGATWNVAVDLTCTGAVAAALIWRRTGDAFRSPKSLQRSVAT